MAWRIRSLYRRAEKRGDAAAKAGNLDEEDRIWDECHARVSKIVCRQMISLQGVWIKLGQFLSTRADVMPDAWIDNLKSLQDAVPREAWHDTARTLDECLGTHGLAAFGSLDREPLATASIASVHRATLDGQPVVIKVQRRGVKAIIESDLRNLRFIVKRVAKENTKYDFTAMVDEWVEETMREVDFVNEALNTETVRHNLAHLDSVKVPQVVRAKGVGPTRRTLVLEYIDGGPTRCSRPSRAARASAACCSTS